MSVQDLDLRCRTIINCAGLSAVALASRVRGSDPISVPEAFFAKGNYFRYTGSCPFRRLVYPLPEPRQAGLGVHATIDLTGQVGMRTQFSNQNNAHARHTMQDFCAVETKYKASKRLLPLHSLACWSCIQLKRVVFRDKMGKCILSIDRAHCGQRASSTSSKPSRYIFPVFSSRF